MFRMVQVQQLRADQARDRPVRVVGLVFIELNNVNYGSIFDRHINLSSLWERIRTPCQAADGRQAGPGMSPQLALVGFLCHSRQGSVCSTLRELKHAQKFADLSDLPSQAQSFPSECR